MIRTALIAALLAGTAATAGYAQANVRPKVELSQAVAAAEKTLGARAFDAELDIDRGRMVYEIDLVKDGKAVEAEVDAQTGAVVRQQRQGLSLPWRDSDLKAAQTAPRSLTDAIAMIEGQTKGKVTDIGLERQGGRDYYEVALAGAQDRDVLVDIQSGAITPVLDD